MNHWVLQSLLIVIVELQLFSHVLMLSAICHFVRIALLIASTPQDHVFRCNLNEDCNSQGEVV